MKIIYVFILILLAAACAKKESDLSHLWKDYDDWGHATGILDYPVPGHGSSPRIIYANKTALISEKDINNKIVRKKGSIVVKEVFKNIDDAANDKNPQKLYIMIKDPDDQRALQGWIYAVQTPGQQYNIVSSRMCIGCHDAANEKHMYFDKNENDAFRDYLFFPLQEK
jgi:Cytochrome P460